MNDLFPAYINQHPNSNLSSIIADGLQEDVFFLCSQGGAVNKLLTRDCGDSGKG